MTAAGIRMRAPRDASVAMQWLARRSFQASATPLGAESFQSIVLPLSFPTSNTEPSTWEIHKGPRESKALSSGTPFLISCCFPCQISFFRFGSSGLSGPRLGFRKRPASFARDSFASMDFCIFSGDEKMIIAPVSP